MHTGFFKRTSVFFLFLFWVQIAYSNPTDSDFFIVDSWISGFFSGLACSKEKRWKQAWKSANQSARNDVRIWKGLFVTDTNLSKKKRFVELGSRVTYQGPQTGLGFFMAHWYNTVLCKVDSVSHPNGSTLVHTRVPWAALTLGSYILARSSTRANPHDKLFQHEYGHYLQSKRMGFAYLIRVGLPSLLSRGHHDYHPVEIDCNREAFLYFNSVDSTFQHDTLLNDTIGWNFSYNPFPDTIGKKMFVAKEELIYIDYQNQMDMQQVNGLKVRAKWFDYASWLVFPVQLIVGLANSHEYNKTQKKDYEEYLKNSHGIFQELNFSGDGIGKVSKHFFE